jgi:hypothetical protein
MGAEEGVLAVAAAYVAKCSDRPWVMVDLGEALKISANEVVIDIQITRGSLAQILYGMVHLFAW